MISRFLIIAVVFGLLCMGSPGCGKGYNNGDSSDSTIVGEPSPELPDKGAPQRHVPFKQMLGVNGFDWNYTNDDATFNNEKFKLIQAFTGFRMYLDWERIEKKEGYFQYSYDEIFEKNKALGMTMLVDLQIIPGWFRKKYYPDEYNEADPYASLRDYTPVPKGANKEDPASYIAMAKLGFQVAARYGRNKNINNALVKAYGWGDRDDTKIGLGTVNYIECSNEPDKDWKGPEAQQSPEQYAAQLSAFYDGHMGALGKNAGVKTADPTMHVVMAGLASPNPDFVRRMIAWCKKNRVKDGKYSLCFDVINYHDYSSARSGDYWANPDLAKNHGEAPELSDAGHTADTFVALRKEVANMPEVWVTECGFDVNPKSIQRALPIGKKSIEDTQADWILRTALLYSRKGINRVFFYMLKDDNPSNSTQYSSSGLVTDDKRRKAADFIVQAKNLLGEYTFSETLNTDPLVDLYVNGNNPKIYVVTVPDQRGRKAKYSIRVSPGVKKVMVYTPQRNADNMKSKTKKVVNGKVKIRATETPTFIQEIN